MKAQTRVDRKRSARRIKLIGAKGVADQEVRKTKSILKAAVTPGDSIDKAKGREAVKRVGEYKKAAAKRKKRPTDSKIARAVRPQDYKKPIHGYKVKIRMKKDT